MDFSTMVLTMYVAAEDDPEDDERVLGVAIEQALVAAELGFNPWFTEHHFRGPWHSSPLQFASYLAPQLPSETYLGFGVLSTPYYNPVRLVESMNLLDHLTKGKTLFGLGSGFAGNEPLGLGVGADYHRSGRAAAETLEVMERLWDFRTGDAEYSYELPTHRGTIRRRVVPSPYRKHRPVIIRTASRDAAVIASAKRGWPAFLGTFGSESSLEEQANLYRKTLEETSHPLGVIEECLRWSTVDWLSVVVAPSVDEALQRAAEAKAEALEVRRSYVERNGPIEGPVVHRKDGESTAAAFAAGGDMWETIAGTPEMVADRVQELVDLGINHLLVRFLGEWAGRTRPISEASMELFAREVMPRFKSVPVA